MLIVGSRRHHLWSGASGTPAWLCNKALEDEHLQQRLEDLQLTWVCHWTLLPSTGLLGMQENAEALESWLGSLQRLIAGVNIVWCGLQQDAEALETWLASLQRLIAGVKIW